MAVLINFSKTISGFLIDVSQVVMLTFVAAFQDMLAVGFIQAFKINDLKSMGTTVDPVSGETNTSDNLSVSLGIIFSVVIAFILLLVLIAMTVMLAVRIVTLWILVVLSPLAYLFSAIPGKFSSYSSEWWKKFSEQLVFGPALAFFIWLTLSVIAESGNNFATTDDYVKVSTGSGLLSNSNYILQYIIGIAMLIIGMNTAKSMGGQAGAMGGKAFDKMKGLSQKGIKKFGSGMATAASRTGEGLTRGGLSLANKVGGGLAAGGSLALAKSVLDDRKQTRKDKAAGKWQDRLDKVGFKDKSYQALGSMAEKWDNKGQKLKTTIMRGGPTGTAAGIGVALAGAPGWAIAGAAAAPVAVGFAATSALFSKNSAFRAAVDKKNKDVKNVRNKRKEVGSNVFKNSSLIVDKENKVKPDATRTMFKDEDFGQRTLSKQELDYEREYDGLVAQVSGAKNRDQAIDKQKALNRFLEASQWAIKDNPAGTAAIANVWKNKISGDNRYVDDKDLRDTDEADIINGNLKNNSTIDVGKMELSKTNYLKDKDIERANNTAEMLAKGENVENMVGQKVNDTDGSGNWVVQKVEGDQVIISKTNVPKALKEQHSMTREEFAEANAPAIAENFYQNEYSKLTEEEKKTVLSPEEYQKFAKQQPMSYDGVTMGSLKNEKRPENIVAAVSMDNLNERTGMDLHGVGAHLRGEEAVLAARGMKDMITEQKEDLQIASTNEELSIALKSFGVAIPKGADGKEIDLLKMREEAQVLYDAPGSNEEKIKKVKDLEDKDSAYKKAEAKHKEHQQYEYMLSQGMDLGAEGMARYEATTLSKEEQQTLTNGPLTVEEKKILENDPRKNLIYQQMMGSDNAIKTLSDEEYVAQNGISIKNKVSSGAVSGKETLYHEFGHALIEKNDPTGQIQNDFWNNLTIADQALAREHIKKTRGAENFAKMKEQDIIKEYFNDALVNETKPGGPATDQPRLPESMRKRIETGTSTAPVPMAEKALRFRQRRAQVKEYKKEQWAAKTEESWNKTKGEYASAEEEQRAKEQYFQDNKSFTRKTGEAISGGVNWIKNQSGRYGKAWHQAKTGFQQGRYAYKTDQINELRTEQQVANNNSISRVQYYNEAGKGTQAIAAEFRANKDLQPQNLMGAEGLDRIKQILKSSGAVTNDLNLEAIAKELQGSLQAKTESKGAKFTGLDAFKDLLKQGKSYENFAQEEIKANDKLNKNYDKMVGKINTEKDNYKTKLGDSTPDQKQKEIKPDSAPKAAPTTKTTDEASITQDTAKNQDQTVNIDVSGVVDAIKEGSKSTKDAIKDIGKDIKDSGKKVADTTNKTAEATTKKQSWNDYVAYKRYMDTKKNLQDLKKDKKDKPPAK